MKSQTNTQVSDKKNLFSIFPRLGPFSVEVITETTYNNIERRCYINKMNKQQTTRIAIAITISSIIALGFVIAYFAQTIMYLDKLSKTKGYKELYYKEDVANIFR